MRLVAIPFRVGWGFSLAKTVFGLDRVEECRNPFQGGMGFFTFPVTGASAARLQVAIPFRVGWGFSPRRLGPRKGLAQRSRNPFQGGMGFFTNRLSVSGLCGKGKGVAIPFRVGWGFSPSFRLVAGKMQCIWSQSLSGWDGVFHLPALALAGLRLAGLSQSLSGWDGVFHPSYAKRRSGLQRSRNPFQGGMGFFTKFPDEATVLPKLVLSQSLSGWDGVFHTR